MIVSLILWIIIHIIVVSIEVNERSWHIFNDTLPNNLLDTSKSSIASSIRRAWNILGEDETKKAYQELFFNYAMDLIYRHQHPSDCSRAKYLISSGYSKGYIHDIHVEGYGLAMALEMNRIYIPSRRSTIPLIYFQSNNSYVCNDFLSVDCYYEVWSNCTWIDIDPIVFNQRNAIRTLKIIDEDNEIFAKNGRISNRLMDKYKDERVVGLNIHENTSYRRLVPYQFTKIVERSNIPENRRYYWWRAISTSYLLRPNKYMQELLRLYSLPSIVSLKGRCVGAFILHSKDKGTALEQMQTHSFKDFSQIAGQMWDTTYANQDDIRKGTRAMVVGMVTMLKSSFTAIDGNICACVIGTDAPGILKEALEWGKKRNWNIIFNPLLLEIFNLKEQDSISFATVPEGINISVNESFITASRGEKKASNLIEFTYFMVTLVDILRCNSYVCTLAANYCRLIDELRAMIAMKPEAFFADLSEESCWEPPCIGPSKFKWMGW